MYGRLMRLFWIGPLAVLGLAVFLALGGLIVRELWNWLLPALFGWPRLGFWQALGLLALCRILFSGFGFTAGPGRRVRHRMADRWDTMSREERERVRERMWVKFGFGPESGEGRES